MRRGALFTIFGVNLGPSSSPSLSFPLSATLGGVSISILKGQLGSSGLLVFVSPGQLNAIMPSDAPTGTVTVAVNYQGQTVGTGTAEVVPSGFGIFTVYSSGSGQGVVTNGSGALRTYDAPAHPGDTLIIWGTGLGPISGSDAEPPPVGNIGASAPVVYVGGVNVTPSYYGRPGCCSGLDQIVFQVPANVMGCSVPLAVQVGGATSNFTSMPVAASSNACPDSDGFSSAALMNLAAGGSASLGDIVY